MKLTYSVFTALFSIGLLGSASLIAQTKPDPKKSEPEKKSGIAEEIEVVRPYKPVLADASKIRRSPDLNSNKSFKSNLTYTFLDKRLELNSDIRQLQAQQLTPPEQAEIRNNYVKIAAGNFNTGLGEVYLNTGKDEALQAGLFLKHLNQKGSLRGQKFSSQQVGVFGKSIQDQFSLNGEASFDRKSTAFYGFDPAILSESKNASQQRYSTLALKGEMLKNFDEDESAFNYGIKADASFLNGNNYGVKENSFLLTGLVNKKISQFNFGLNASLDLTATKDSTYSISNNIARLNPYIKLQASNYKLVIGVNLVSEFGDNSRTNFLPAISGELSVFPDYAIVFGGFSGDVLKTTLREFAAENPYLVKGIAIKNAVEKSNIYGGIKGNAGAGLGYKATVYFKTIHNMPLFINNKATSNKFELIYDEGNSTNTGIEGEVNVKASDILTLTGKIIANTYSLASQTEAWYKPGISLTSSARLNVNKKLVVDGEVLFGGARKALLQTPTNHIVTLDSFVDLSAGAEYRLKNQLGAYLRLNNIFGNEYQTYLYYPKLGLNFLAGFNYSF